MWAIISHVKGFINFREAFDFFKEVYLNKRGIKSRAENFKDVFKKRKKYRINQSLEFGAITKYNKTEYTQILTEKYLKKKDNLILFKYFIF